MDNDIRSTGGAVLVGGAVAIFLSGTVAMQVIIYSKLYVTDPLKIKAVVLLLWLLDILHTLFTVLALWKYLIMGWGQPALFNYVAWSIASTVLLTAMTTFLVQCFFAYRVYTVSHKSICMAVIIVTLAVVRLGAALASTAEMVRLHSLIAFKDQIGYVFTIGLSASAALDILVTVSLCYFLRKSRTGFSSMDAVIDSLTFYTVQNGFLTFITTLTTLICWLLLSNLVFLGLHLTIEKLYANAFMATLNARKSLRTTGSSHEHHDCIPLVWQSAPPRGVEYPPQLASSDRISVPTKVHANVETTQSSGDDRTSKYQGELE
ncbi:hypothetical protein B0H21DRAFT_254421 [Amylocystis lapponica]|nr:hypothetical protein B0H21DRAFT_254421 [Amylocystis lapponica]